jgi:hypothetical protein
MDTALLRCLQMRRNVSHKEKLEVIVSDET